MDRTRVKICGVMRPADAIAAARAGADAIGIVMHHRAGRFVPPDLAIQIVDATPAMVTPFGLFVDEPFESLMSIIDQLRLRHVQLHGDETPEFAARLTGCVVVKAINVDRQTLPDVLDRWKNGPANVRGIVLETAHTGQAGGSGVVNDWIAVREAMDAGLFDGLPPIIAAGGINPQNVGDVIQTIDPWAIDVSSGVESRRGEKSLSLMKDLMRAVKTADAGKHFDD